MNKLEFVTAFLHLLTPLILTISFLYQSTHTCKEVCTKFDLIAGYTCLIIVIGCLLLLSVFYFFLNY